MATHDISWGKGFVRGPVSLVVASLLAATAMNACSVSSDGLGALPAVPGTGGEEAQGGSGGESDAGGAANGGSQGGRQGGFAGMTAPGSATGGSGLAGSSGSMGGAGTGGTGSGGSLGQGGGGVTGTTGGSGVPTGSGGLPPDAGAPGTGGTPGTGGSPGTPTTMDAGPGPIVPAPKKPCQEARQDLVACFDFEDTVKDNSSSGFNATANGAAFATGVEGKALVLGPGRAVRVPPNPLLDQDQFTIDALVRLNRLPTGSARMGIVDSDLRYGLFVMPGGNVVCTAPGASVTANGVVSANRWLRIACSRSTSAITISIDGQTAATGLATNSPGIRFPKELVIGGNEPSGDELDGLMDTLRIWRTARSVEK